MKKIFSQTTILTDSQVRIMAKRVREMLTEAFPAIDWKHHDPEVTIRMMALSAKCKQTREKRCLSVKDVAAQLHVPQYRIKAIEENSKGEVKPDCLRAYISFLGLKRWVHRWVAANPELAARLEIADL